MIFGYWAIAALYFVLAWYFNGTANFPTTLYFIAGVIFVVYGILFWWLDNRG